MMKKTMVRNSVEITCVDRRSAWVRKARGENVFNYEMYDTTHETCDIGTSWTHTPKPEYCYPSIVRGSN